MAPRCFQRLCVRLFSLFVPRAYYKSQHGHYRLLSSAGFAPSPRSPSPTVRAGESPLPGAAKGPGLERGAGGGAQAKRGRKGGGWAWWSRVALFGGVGLAGAYAAGRFARDPQGTMDRLWDVRERFREVLRYFSNPSRKKLLPDVEPELQLYPGGPGRKTLLLEMQGVLGQTSYSRQNGWTFKKRPGASAFIAYMATMYELVLFTTENMFDIDWAIPLVDPTRCIHFQLYRPETQYVRGKHIKDLTYLNRPLDRVISLDDKQSSSAYQPENLLPIPTWDGDENDKVLLDLVPLLEAMAEEDVHDVREMLGVFREQGTAKAIEEQRKKAAAARARASGLLHVFRGDEQSAGMGNIDEGAREGGSVLGRLMGGGMLRSGITRRAGDNGGHA